MPRRGNTTPGRDAAVLAAVWAFWAEHARPPKVRDVQAACDITSTSATGLVLDRLAAAGKLEREVDDDAGGGRFTRGIWPAGMRERVAAMFRDGRRA